MRYAIIAAGEGSRLSSEGYTGLKPMVRVNGEMLIDRLIQVFMQNDAESITVIINENADELAAHLQAYDPAVPLQVVTKTTESSLHSFNELIAACPGAAEICLTTTDAVFEKEEFKQYINMFRASPDSDGLLAVTSYIDDESPLYIAFDESHRVSAITDQPAAAPLFVSGGIYCLRRAALDLVPAAIETGVHRMRNYQRMLIEKGLKLYACPFSKIMDVDHVTDIVKAEQFLNEVEV